ncbi:MAG: magnesium transporter CorA family protein [Cellulosilyticaceae bacterium]
MQTYQITSEGMIERYEGDMGLKLGCQWWIILTPEELIKHKDQFKISHKTIKECVEQVDLPKLEVYDQYDFGLIHMIERRNEQVKKYRLNFYLGSTYLLLVAEEPTSGLEQFVEEMVYEEEVCYSPEKILYLLLDHVIGEEGQILDGIENEVDRLEERVIRGEKHAYIQEIVALRKRLLYLKKHYEPMIDIANALEENDNELFDPKSTRYFRILSNRINRLNMRVLNLRDNVTQIREAYDAQVDIGLNKIMKVFTVMTVIFFPLTVIVGWYGMNFTAMPELDWRYGYIYVMILSVLSIAGCLIYFKKKDWL